MILKEGTKWNHGCTASHQEGPTNATLGLFYTLFSRFSVKSAAICNIAGWLVQTDKGWSTNREPKHNFYLELLNLKAV